MSGRRELPELLERRRDDVNHPDDRIDQLARLLGGPPGPVRTAALRELNDPDTDRALVDGVLDRLGHEAARHAGALDAVISAVYERRFARAEICRYLLDEHDVDDALQEVVLVVSRQISTFRGDGHLASWVAGIARRKAIDVLRRKRDVPAERDLDTEIGRFSSQLATRQDLDAALGTLSADHEQIVRLRDLEHLSYAEIAERLGINVGTVRSRLARARAQLATTLQDETARGDTT